MKIRSKEQGFTLIELLLVVVIIGILLAVIVPRAWRANIDAKYGMVRQNATELASIGVQWAENQLNGQDTEGSDAQLVHYLAFIAGGNTQDDPTDGSLVGSNTWVAGPDTNDATSGRGWTNIPDSFPGREVGGTSAPVSGPAQEMMPIDKRARNPFNGQDIFRSPQNDPANFGEAIPGAIASGYAVDGELGDSWFHFGLRFQGSDNTTTDFDGDNTFHADMNGGGVADSTTQLNSLRSGIFMARAQYVD